jgi:alpha-beta hydrolase superfamily lysophospholipase
MKMRSHGVGFVGLVFALAALGSAAAPGAWGGDAAPKGFATKNADVAGVKIHYTVGGAPAGSPAVILLHGYAETSRMWTPLLPLLADKFIVIAPDLPGIGDSSIPADGYDMGTAAKRIHDW